MNEFFKLFLSFYIYSFIGWVIETIYVSLKQNKIANRGFLIGPYCPIYGVSAILMVSFLGKYKHDVLTLFIWGALIASILEYFTSLILEKLFKIRWWDYSNYRFNIDGRVCLNNSVIFGLLCVILVNYMNPVIETFINKIPTTLFDIASPIIMITFTVDCILSFITIFKIKKVVSFNQNIRKDYTSEITEKVKDMLIKDSKRFKRILNAFPNLHININIINRFK